MFLFQLFSADLSSITLAKDQLLCFASLPDTLDNEVRGRNFLTRLQPELSGNFLPDADSDTGFINRLWNMEASSKLLIEVDV